MATRNYRVGELEVKPNYTSVVRGYNFDSRYYANDKDAPAEDIADYSGLADPGPFTQNCYPNALGAWYVAPADGWTTPINQIPVGPTNLTLGIGVSPGQYYLVIAADKKFSKVRASCAYDASVNVISFYPFQDYIINFTGGGYYGSQANTSSFALNTVSDNSWGTLDSPGGIWQRTGRIVATQLNHLYAQGNTRKYPFCYDNSIYISVHTGNHVWTKGINAAGPLGHSNLTTWRESLYNHYVAIWPPYSMNLWNRPIDNHVYSASIGLIPSVHYAGKYHLNGVDI
jgi:hypothetical protein